jgi:hypothetical protein
VKHVASRSGAGALSLVLLICTAAPVVAQSAPPSPPATDPMGPLAPYVLQGPDEEGPWVGSTVGEEYVLTNESEPGAVTYVYLEPGPIAAGPTEVSVGVEVETLGASDLAVAGGVFVDPEPEVDGYYAFVLHSDGLVALWERGEEGLGVLASTSSEALRPEGANILSVGFDGATLDMSLNGTSIVTVGVASGPVTAPRVGVIGIGQGRFAFSEFRLEPRGAGPDDPLGPTVSSSPSPSSGTDPTAAPGAG